MIAKKTQLQKHHATIANVMSPNILERSMLVYFGIQCMTCWASYFRTSYCCASPEAASPVRLLSSGKESAERARNKAKTNGKRNKPAEKQKELKIKSRNWGACVKRTLFECKFLRSNLRMHQARNRQCRAPASCGF